MASNFTNALLIYLMLGVLPLLPFVPAVAAGSSNKDPPVVSLAAAYDSALSDGWARYLYWQALDGKIVVQYRGGKDRQAEPIPDATTARKYSPLVALYSASREYPGANNLVLSYLDQDNQIFDVSCRHENESYVSWATIRTEYKTASGLTAASVNGTRRLFYIDDEDYVVEGKGGVGIRLGPKAARGSNLAATVPVRSNDIYLFFVSADDKSSLVSLVFKNNDNRWSNDLPAIPGFTSDPATNFAAAAWSDAPAVRIFYIAQDTAASEWTLQGTTSRSWVDTTDTLSKVKGVVAGEPVAAERSSNGSGRYIGYFYSAAQGRINSLGRNFIDGPLIQNEFATFELPEGEPPFTTVENIGIILPVLALVVSVLIPIVTCMIKKRKNKGHTEKNSADPEIQTQTQKPEMQTQTPETQTPEI